MYCIYNYLIVNIKCNLIVLSRDVTRIFLLEGEGGYAKYWGRAVGIGGL